MTVIALATSGTYGEVGLALPGGRVACAPLGEGAARGRGLLPAVETLLAEAGLAPTDLAWVAVDVGPGSFTGIRVGVTAAKTLAFALGIPAVGVLSLAALARAAPPKREILAIRDAGRGRLYHARFGPMEDDQRPELAPPGRAPGASVLSAAGSSLIVGEDAPGLLEASGCPGDALTVRAGAEAVLAEARAAPPPSGAGAGSSHRLAPVYLQASTPERRRAGEVDPGEGPAGT